MKERLIFHLDFNHIESLSDVVVFYLLQTRTHFVCVCGWRRAEGCGHIPFLKTVSNSCNFSQEPKFTSLILATKSRFS